MLIGYCFYTLSAEKLLILTLRVKTDMLLLCTTQLPAANSTCEHILQNLISFVSSEWRILDSRILELLLTVRYLIFEYIFYNCLKLMRFAYHKLSETALKSLSD